METFRILAACDACDALHAVTGVAPRGPMAAAATAFSCRACGRGYCRTPVPADVDVSSLRIELEPPLRRHNGAQ